MIFLIAALIPDDWLLYVVATCFGGGIAFSGWAWSQIKRLSATVRALEHDLSHLQAAFTLVKNCPAARCPLESMVESLEGNLRLEVKHG